MTGSQQSFTPDLKTTSFKLKGIQKSMQEVTRDLKAQFPEDPDAKQDYQFDHLKSQNTFERRNSQKSLKS